MKKITRSELAGKFGWKPDLPDTRDFLFSAPLQVLRALPTKVDLRSKCPSVLDQGQLGSCTANAIANMHKFTQMKEGKPEIMSPSRLFIYYNERDMEGTIPIDNGAYIRDGFKSISKQGVCPESMWKYVISHFATKPPANCFTEALNHQALQYMRLVQSLGQLKGCLAAGFPFVFGFTVYESFESQEVANTGIVPYPSDGEGVVGGHAVMAVGYDDANQRFIVQNSWGKHWGQKGFFTIPYGYLTDSNLSDDFWTLRVVE
jgi:C1A family cysteine protease